MTGVSFPRETCPACDGEGTILVTAGMTFNDREECYYPNEEEVPCETCRGTGLDQPCHSCNGRGTKTEVYIHPRQVPCGACGGSGRRSDSLQPHFGTTATTYWDHDRQEQVVRADALDLSGIYE